MNVSMMIARRLRLDGSAGSRATVIIAVASVALSLMVMEFTLAIVFGFKEGIRAKLSGFDAQVSVEAPLVRAGEVAVVDADSTLLAIVGEALPEGASVRRTIRQPGLLKTDDNFEGVIFIGQSATGTSDGFDFEKGIVTDGVFPDFDADSCRNSAVISEPMAADLGLAVGDKVYATFIVDGNVRLRRLRVDGLYKSNFGEYDRTVAYTSMAGLQSVLGVDSMAATRLDIRGLEDSDVDEAATRLQQTLVQAAADGRIDSYYPVSDIHRTGALYFNWLALLDTNVVVIFILMLAVAAFTLVSSLFILVLERVRMIGVLRAIGASRTMVRNIFVDLGMRLVGLGMIIGNVLGLGLLLVQQYTHAVPLDPEMYYLSSVPVLINLWAMLALHVGVAAVAAAVLLVPARMAASTSPAEVIAAD